MNRLQLLNLKIRCLICIVFITLFANQGWAQDKYSAGVNVSTSFQLNSHRQRQTGIWSSESGYGFMFGVPVRIVTSEDRAVVFGADYEFISFDNRVNGSLVSSTRFHSIHLPAVVQFSLISTLYATAGAGANIMFRSRYFAPGSNVDIGITVQPFQPYISLGVASIVERAESLYELSIATRLHFLDLRNSNYINFDAVSSRLISFDLGMKFYF